MRGGLGTHARAWQVSGGGGRRDAAQEAAETAQARRAAAVGRGGSVTKPSLSCTDRLRAEWRCFRESFWP